MGIDVKTLWESASSDPEFAEDLLNLFEEHTHEGMARLVDASCRKDAEGIASLAHKLVGSAVACGFVNFSKELRSLELRCLQDLPDDMPERIGSLGRLFEEGCIGMAALLKDERS